MRIVFLGINRIGQQIYDWLSEQNENVIALLTNKEELASLSDLAPDLIISAGFRHILSEESLSIPPLGCINFHKAYLPYNRGANPTVWAILQGSPAGVTIHYMDRNIDTGNILTQRKVKTDFGDTAKTLYEKLEQAQFELFIEFWPEFKRGNRQGRTQTNKGTFYQIADFKRLRRIDPNKSYRALDLLNLLRAMTFPPFNNCYVELGGKRYFLRLEITEGSFSSQSKDDKTMLHQYK